MKKFIIFIYVSTLLFRAQGQNKQVADSLIKLLKVEAPDTNRVWNLLALAFEYRRADANLAEKYCKEGMMLSEKLKFDPGRALAYNHYGVIYKYRGDFSKSLEMHLKALEIRQKLKDQSGIGSSYNNLGNTYGQLRNYEKAMEYHLKYLKMQEEEKDQEGIGNAYDNISSIYTQKGDMNKALEYAEKCLEIRKNLGDSLAYGRQLEAVAFLYYEKNRFSDALNYYKKALAIFERHGDDYRIAMIYSVMGNVLLETGKPQEAIRYQKLGLAMSEKIGDAQGVLTAYLSLGQSLIHVSEYKQADVYIHKGIDMAKDQNSLEALKDAYEILTELYKGEGNYQKALESHFYYMKLKDSAAQQQNSQVIEELKTKYETDKKDRQIKEVKLERNNAQLTAQRRKIYIVIIVILIVAVGGVTLLLYNHGKLKQRQLMDAELIKQQELQNRAVLEAEEKERVRIARDLHDGVGQLLSAARMQVSGLDYILKDAEESGRSAFQNALKLLDDSVKEVRGVSHSMIPNALLRSGLVAAVREFVDRLTTERLKIDLQIVGLQERLESQMETVLYRVLQEIVSNTVKYSGASNVSIQLIRHNQEITLMVEDNGKGFNVDEVMNSEKSGIGIKNIMARVQYLKGEVHFDSALNKGTTVTVEIPIIAPI